MLPFLKNKANSGSGLLIKSRSPDQAEPEESEIDVNAPIRACAKDLIIAIHAHDVEMAADAIRAAFEILDSEPHVEGPHVDPHSYNSQKE